MPDDRVPTTLGKMRANGVRTLRPTNDSRKRNFKSMLARIPKPIAHSGPASVRVRILRIRGNFFGLPA